MAAMVGRTWWQSARLYVTDELFKAPTMEEYFQEGRRLAMLNEPLAAASFFAGMGSNTNHSDAVVAGASFGVGTCVTALTIVGARRRCVSARSECLLQVCSARSPGRC